MSVVARVEGSSERINPVVLREELEAQTQSGVTKY